MSRIKMNIVLLLIILMDNKMAMNFAFTSSNTWLHMEQKQNTQKEFSYTSNIQLPRFRRDSPQSAHQFISTPGYRTDDTDRSFSNNNPTQLSATFCPLNPYSYSPKSIVVSNAGLMSRLTLSVPNQPQTVMGTSQARGTLFIFNNPPASLCYSLNLPSQTSSVNTIDINNIKVQFIYDYSSLGNGGGTTPSGSNNNLGGSSSLSTPNTNTACGSVICQNGGVCRYMGATGYQCQCDSSNQWLGTDCSKANPCMRSPCMNNGQCYYLPDATYYCICYSGYSGNNCQFSATTTTTASSYNPCWSARPCLNGGTCITKGNQGEFTCMCPQGYTGINCQLMNYFTTTTTPPLNTCGIAVNKSPVGYSERIINGQSVYNQVWPWLVSLQRVSDGSHFCGGTLVDAFHVVTAAHCFDAANTSPSMFKVVAGLLNLQQTYTAGVQQLAIDRIFRHEQYSSTALMNDIAVIKLRTAAQINSAVYPICLPNRNGAQDPKVGQNVQIAGWGYTNSATQQLAQQLQQATIQILDINGDLYGGPGCNAWIRRGYTMNNAQQICAMSRDTRTDSCQGDSGGPLIRDIGSQWFLFGIVGYGDAVCASSTAAGVYTRVSAYTVWIEQKLQL